VVLGDENPIALQPISPFHREMLGRIPVPHNDTWGQYDRFQALTCSVEIRAR
jgi:hypothetical protein